MNSLFHQTRIGTLGELIAQTHLLAHGVQAAPPIKDSGNDLIGIFNGSFRAIQVRTSIYGNIKKPKPKKLYHILACVYLPFDGPFPRLEGARVFLFQRNRVETLSGRMSRYNDSLISDNLVLAFWSGESD